MNQASAPQASPLDSSHVGRSAGDGRRFLLGFLSSLLLLSATAHVLVTQFDWFVINDIEQMVIAKREAVRDKAFAMSAGKEKVVVLGDSKLTAGFVPAIFDSATGHRTTTLNLALPSHDLSRHYYQLTDYVAAYGVPKYVILQLRESPGIAAQFPLGATIQELFERAIQESAARVALMRALFPAAYVVNRGFGFPSWPGVSGLLHLGDLHRERLRPVNEMIRDRGVFWWGGGEFVAFPDDSGSNGPPMAVSNDLDPSLRPWLARFLAYTDQRQVQVLLVTTPARAGRVIPPSAPLSYIAEIVRENANVHQASTGWELKAYPNRLFFDDGHLNRAGANVYTRDIASEFMAVFPAHHP